ncbi:MAG TPA: NB-ARC domain-containing protein [Ktedonobacterales bacterium]|nr:NB-ARC domain-containing protein [Ktedonobacterales bacterium]
MRSPAPLRIDNNLPSRPTPLLGREQELAAVCALLRRDDARLVTLTGPGGVGKTRLSLRVAADLLDDFADGVWYTRLSRLADPALVLPTLAATLGLQEGGSRPIADTLRAYLRERELLLVLDNFEQVVAAAPEVAALLEAAPRVKLLVTSRVALRLRDEQEYPLAPLALPDVQHLPSPDRLTQYAAVALFIERAGKARPAFAVTAANAPAIAEICTRLDGLPLAIELAAARVKLLPPEALLARLSRQLTLLTAGARDLEARQQTMRASIAWSEQLLTPAERTLFRRLAVFAGGATMEAIETVCREPAGVAPLESDVLNGLGALVDQSLVQQRHTSGEPRFSMLRVIREYALEQLEASGDEAAVNEAHASYFLALAEQADLGIRGREVRAWLERLTGEQDNLRGALTWLHAQRDAFRGLRLTVALCEFWWLSGFPSEAREWLDAMLSLDQSHSPIATVHGSDWKTLQARALIEAGRFAYMRGLDMASMRQAEAVLERALEVARATATPLYVVTALAYLSALADLSSLVEYPGDPARGAALFDEALTLARRTGDDDTLLAVVTNPGAQGMMQIRGETDRAVALATEGLELARRLGRKAIEIGIGHVLFMAPLRRNDSKRTRELLVDGIRAARDHLLVKLCPNYILGFALLAAHLGQHERAARLMGAAMALTERMGTGTSDEEDAMLIAYVQASRDALGGERWAENYAAGQSLSLDDAIVEALQDEHQVHA